MKEYRVESPRNEKEYYKKLTAAMLADIDDLHSLICIKTVVKTYLRLSEEEKAVRA